MSSFLQRLFSKEFFKKDITMSICIALILAFILNLVGFDTKCERLRKDILRLHILANSDSEQDQRMKLEIRDCIVAAGGGIFEGAENKDEAMLKAKEQMDKFKTVAENVVKSYGKDYNITVCLEKTYFDTREYEEFTLPAGEYDALKVLVGEAKGKNWWCIMFPSMCIPAAKASKSIAEVTGNGAAEITENPQKYKMEFKIVEIFERLKIR